MYLYVVDHFRWKLHVYLAYSIDASKCAIGKTQRKRCVASVAGASYSG